MRTTDRFFQEPYPLRQFIELSSEILIHLNSDQTVIHINQKGCNLLGYSADEIIGKNWFDNFVPAEIRSEMVEIFNQIINREIEIPSHFENPIITSQGELRTISWYNASIKDPDGKITGTLSSGEDITKRLEAERQRDQSTETYRALFGAATDGICIVDIEKRMFIEVNPTLCKMLGFSREEMLEKSVLDIHPEDSREHVAKEFSSHTRNEKFFSRNLPCLHKSGKLVYIDVTSTITMINNREVIVGFFKDVTEQRQMEKKIRHSQNIDALGTLAGGIAHDFNNMLFIISGNISYALSYMERDNEIYEPLSDALDGAKQAQSLTQQLLTFAKGGAPIKQATDINRLIKSSADFISRGSKAKCIFDLAENIWAADIDEGQINQVISNLVMNSIQAMPHGGRINIRTKNTEAGSRNNADIPPGRYVKVIIEDQGTGIPDKYLNEIFAPFFTTKQTGNGLGLATTYSIVKKHGGNIKVYSKLHTGTTFHIYLPASATSLSPLSTDIERKHYGHGKILIMDDQQSVLNTSRRFLQNMGYSTAGACSGEQAIAMYREQYETNAPYDLVILDLTMPGGLSGLQTLSHLQKIDPKVKAIVSSGYSNDPIMANYRYYGFCGVAPKPYTKQQLATILNQIFNTPTNDRPKDALDS